MIPSLAAAAHQLGGVDAEAELVDQSAERGAGVAGARAVLLQLGEQDHVRVEGVGEVGAREEGDVGRVQGAAERGGDDELDAADVRVRVTQLAALFLALARQVRVWDGVAGDVVLAFAVADYVDYWASHLRVLHVVFW